MSLGVSAGRFVHSVGAMWVGAPRHVAVSSDSPRPDFLLLQLPRRVAAATVRAAGVVATLGDVLLTRCCGSRLRVNLLPTYLVGELAAELRGHGATKSALAVGSVQHLGRCHV